LAFVACVLATSPPAGADTFRCGAAVVSESNTIVEIVARCGSPLSHTSRSEPIRAPTVTPGVTREVGTTTTEEWTFSRGTSARPFVVTVVDGKVRSLRLAPP
jgi:hypothetical protein